MIEDLPVPGESSTSPSSGAPRSAGALLRAAREREGLHVAVLAATIKVSPAKLEALEQDRYEDLPNATFARALAQSVCRSLKVDPRPVLALLPQPDAPPLEGAMGRLNTPFQERGTRGTGAALVWASKPLYWAGGVLMLAAVGVALLPAEWVDRAREQAAEVMSAAPAASAAASAPGSVIETVAVEPAATRASDAGERAAPSEAAMGQGTASSTGSLGTAVPSPSLAPSAAAGFAVATAPTAAATPAAGAVPMVGAATSAPGTAPALQGVLRLSATAASWVEVVDGRGQTVFSRVLQPGESVGVDGASPLRLQVGNAPGTTVVFRGEPRDLSPYTRGNVARLELR